MSNINNTDYLRNLKSCTLPETPNPMFQAVLATLKEREAEKTPMTPSQLKVQERDWLMMGSYYPYDIPEDDGFEFPYRHFCDVCGSACANENKVNLTYAWLGLGPEEHCWKCGAEPEHHDPFYSGRFENWRIDFILNELNRVEEAYRSMRFMTRDQIAKNRYYFSAIISALKNSDCDYWPERYDFSVNMQQSQELYIRIIQLATIKHGGDREAAIKEYQFVSLEPDDLFKILDELNHNLNLPFSYKHY